MAVELKVPSVGESITEVEIGEWLKGEGDRAERDETVVMIETEKATVEVSAPVGGKIGKILKKSGEQASIGEVIGYIEEGDAGEREKGADRAAATPRSAIEDRSKESEPAARPREREAPAKADQPQSEAGIARDEKLRVMPAARRELAERGLKPEEVKPTGPGGRLLKEDVLRHAETEERGETAEAKPRTVPSDKTAAREEEAVRMTPLRRRIAERLVQAQQSAALLTTFNEIDMSRVIALRRQYQESFQERYRIKLGFMSFFVKASVEALKQVPQVNAEIRGAEIIFKNYYDIGVAVGSGRGLAVPVLRNAERMSFAEIEIAIADFAQRAQENKLRIQELEGGTFTISNGGIYGSLLSTPIVNPPQSGILGMHAIQERPVARDGAVVIRPMMFVALTYDHRIVDGREAVTFLRHIKELIEDPARILLEI